MYIILNKETGIPKKLTFESHNNESMMLNFENKRKAKQYMRSKKINKKNFEIMFMTDKEIQRYK